MEPGFENAEDLKGSYLGLPFKDITEAQARAFFACIQKADFIS